jgi:hypothetical protein
MPRGKQATLRSRAKYAARVATSMKSNGVPYTAHADNLTPDRVFIILNKRISWLNDKIAIRKASNLPYFLYLEEREALIWMQDKIHELCLKLSHQTDTRKE